MFYDFSAAKLAGVDLELAIVKLNSRFSLLEEAVNKSLLNEEELRTSAKRLFTVRMILGEFDPPDDNPWNQVTTAGTCESYKFKFYI